MMNMNDNSAYKAEVQEKWGNTSAYREYSGKTKNYSQDQWQNATNGLNAIFEGFSICMKNGLESGSEEPQSLVKKLQNHITENYYNCTKEILSGLGQMYVADERFKNNIDKHTSGTADFVSKAIKTYCA